MELPHQMPLASYLCHPHSYNMRTPYFSLQLFPRLTYRLGGRHKSGFTHVEAEAKGTTRLYHIRAQAGSSVQVRMRVGIGVLVGRGVWVDGLNVPP